MRRLSARGWAYVVAAIIALSFSYDLLRMPVQVFDSLGELLDAQQSPSVQATFVGAMSSAAYLRPLRLAQIKALFDVANGRYWLLYRGFHAVLLAVAVLLFVRALDVRTWPDFAAAAFALTVFTGLHTFRGTVREAFPINHFLEIVVLCLVALNLARARGGWAVDVMAAVTFIVASLTLESGLLVWVVVVTAWACGMPGISRRGVVAVTALLGVYLWVRFYYLSIGTPGLMERSAGFLLDVLDTDELQRQFGDAPIRFYAYNVVASMMSVLFSEPQSGVFESVRAWLRGDVPPRLYLATVSSIMTTALIVLVGATRLFDRARRGLSANDQLLIIFAVVLVANASFSYAYTKDEIVSVAGAFYALAAFAAARVIIDCVGRSSAQVRRAVLCLMLSGIATMWAFRSLGVHHLLRVQAFTHRNDWARPVEARYLEPGAPPDGPAAALIRQLRHDALEMRLPNRHLLPRWTNRWWGE